MNNKPETSADIIAEMRGADNKCQLATKDGSGCYHCPFGSAASNCLFDKYADRLEAAWKREKNAIEANALAVGGMVEAARTTAKKSLAVGDCAKLREALTKVSEWMAHRIATGGFEFSATFPTMLEDVVLPALAAPPRNCDVGTAEEQEERYIKLKREHVDRLERCPAVGHSFFPDSLYWAQMPYEEGGAK